MAPSHFEHANGAQWSRKLFFGRPLWQVTLAGSAVIAIGVMPTLYQKWMGMYRSHHPLSASIPVSSLQARARAEEHHPHVHADNLNVRLGDIHHHNVILTRLEKERQWIMFG